MDIQIQIDSASLKADLVVPHDAKGIVLFAHGSGSSRFSPRNIYVAEVLNKVGFVTLLLDLLTSDEEKTDLDTAVFRFDIDFLAERLVQATKWAIENEKISDSARSRLGYFGASTGAAAALAACAQFSSGQISAIVSRGGRPDLAYKVLSKITTPTLFIVGGNDKEVLELNQEALGQIEASEKELSVIPGATHLFEERGALEAVAKEAVRWFGKYLV
ncbi:MAG: alpha/beta hydrolase [bacterium]|nr:alpha/beta hydrolase [bacterium]